MTNIRIPENELPIRDLAAGDYVRVVSEAGKSCRVPKYNFARSSDVSELDGKIDDTKTELEGEIDAINGIYYGYSATSESAQVKVVTSSDFVLETGKYIVVSFSQRNTYDGTVKLNINDTGAYDVQRGVTGFSYETPYVPIMYLFRVDRQANKYVYRLVGPAYKTASTTEPGYMSTADKAKLDGIEPQANKTVVDDALSDTSENPVQNKVITGEIDDLKDDLNSKADIIISSASGSIAHFEDGANYDAVDVVAYLEPVQSGTGDPSPTNVRPITGHTGVDVVRAGKNILDESVFANYGGVLQSDGTWYLSNLNLIYGKSVWSNPNKYTGSVAITLTRKTTASASSIRFRINYTDGTYTRIGYEAATGGTDTYTVVTSANKTVESVVGDYGSNYASYVNMQIEISTTASSYEEYNGTTYPITFPSEAGTVYGGYVDVTQGKLVVDRAIAIFDGTETYTNNYFPTVVCNKTFTKGDASGGSFVNSHLPSLNAACNYTNSTKQTFQFGKADEYWGVSSADELKTIFAQQYANGTPVAICYPLATPIEYDLTPTAIELLKGVNNVWNDGNGDTDVTYKADTKLYIEQLTKPTEDDMTANTAIASGKFFMVGNRLFLSTTTIASGDTINPGTNCTEMSLADALNTL